jgi:25S rRNA (cytosine2278-C5)-methyltransferase
MSESDKKKKIQGSKKFSKSPYHEAADLLNRVLETKHHNLKAAACSKNGQLLLSTRSYAVVAKVLQERHVIDEILKQVPRLLATVTVKNEGLLYILLFELLFSERQKIIGGGALKRSIIQHEKALRSALKDYFRDYPSNKLKINSSAMELSASFPRYVRVNSCVASVPWFLLRLSEAALPTASFYVDRDVPDLFVVPPSLTSKILSTFRQNEIVLQDKSSCFSALCLVSLLDDDSTGDILDACAAPGNKTSHCAALLHRMAPAIERSNQRTIYALDRDGTRFRTLSQRMRQLVPKHVVQEGVVPSGKGSLARTNCRVEVQHQDFLSTTDQDFPTVSAILLDPSCSGSGLYARISLSDDDDNGTEGAVDRSDLERLQKLSGFQTTALRHALTAFPNVQTVVYSTCSVHVEENECVVSNVLSSADMRKEWELVAPKCLQSWSRRGQSIPSDHSVDVDPTMALTRDDLACLIRTNEEDATNGFFVACFQRKSRKLNMDDRSKADGEEDPWKFPNRQWNVPFYQGQFKTCNEENVTHEDAPSTPKRSETTRPSTDNASLNEASEAKSCKKRQKKLEWKRRQQEAKRLRLQK